MTKTKESSKELYKRNKRVYGELHPYVIWMRMRMSPVVAPFYLLFIPVKLIKCFIHSLKKTGIKRRIDKGFQLFLKNNKGRKVSEFIKPIALYLPQYHEIPENNAWWGKGFTEWTNVRKARPLYDGHYQPHVPHQDVGYYDLSDVNVMRRQAEMAKKYGIYGFCFYYYHFANGKRLLEKPLDNWLKAKEIDFPFCFAWANENWTRSWDGGNKEVIMPQDYDEQNLINMLDDMLPAFRDKRYIKVDDKPLLLVYRAEIIPDIQKLTEKWRSRIKENGFKGLYLVSMQNFKSKNPYKMGFDAAVEFAPQAVKKSFNTHVGHVGTAVFECDATVLSMNEVLEAMTNRDPVSYPRMKCVCPSWDNTARRGKKGARLIYDASPAFFDKFMRASVKETLASQGRGSSLSSTHTGNFLFINAWNEWGEGAYLEPDEKYGYKWLEIIKDIQNQAVEDIDK